jgi:hypothetical protein
MDIKASDLSARLLANENLSVIRARTRTASFDIKARVLTLPLWKDMTPEIEDMLTGHEVGHALYTGDEYLVPIQEDRKIMTYLNVLEDVRIEKMIKRKYPGLRKRMNEGYKQLNDRDFFGVKQVQNFDDLLLIDKINLYFKAGFQCGVTFTPEEKLFVNRAERTETIDEVVELAKEIYGFSKEELQEKKKRVFVEDPEELEESDEEPEGEFDDIDDYEDNWEQEDSDEDQDEKSSRKTHGGKSTKSDDEPSISEEELESKTDRNFADKLQDLADDSTQYNYVKFDDKYFKDPIVGYKTILNETIDNWYVEDKQGNTKEMTADERNQFALDRAKYDKFKTDSTRAVNYLVKEFEMRKSAALYKRAQVSKTGSLDMKRVWSYKLNDDLFKRVSVVPQGKNHGMLFLLDWSGSMDQVMKDTLEQVINLAMFCARIQIPYRVLAFTSQYGDRYNENYDKQREWNRIHNEYLNTNNMLNTNSNFSLLELFSNKMTTSEFHTMARRVTNYKFFWNDGYSMGGTPLNEALVWVYNNLGTYTKQNAIEKMTLITLTDGEGSALYTPNGRMEEHENVYSTSGYKKIKHKYFIRDDKTQKTYQLNKNSNEQTSTIIQMIKDRHNCVVVGFYICRNARRDLCSAIRSNLPVFSGNEFNIIDTWRKEFRDQGFASIKGTGRDDLFLVPQSSTKIVEGELEVKEDANAKAIARNFSKFLNVKQTSRVLLNRFVGYVA